MTYYKQINNVKYDKSLLDLADKLTQSQGDGRISEADINTIFEASKDGHTVTDIEKLTLEYIYNNYNFTNKAKEFYSSEYKKI